MQSIKFFKLQAKNLYKDYQTQFLNTEHEIHIFDYSPKYFDINEIFNAYDFENIEEIKADDFNLMKAQHLFSRLLDYKSWSDLINAPTSKQELSILLYKNKFDLDEWYRYVSEINTAHGIKLSYEEQTEWLIEHFIGKYSILNDSYSYVIHNF